MTKAVQKITLSASRNIPFDKLVLSQSNVRRQKAGVSIEQLAESIAQRTLLQSLSVRPILDANGAKTDKFEVPAGGRRYRALELLVQQKRLAKTALVPCVVRLDGLAEDDSLAENDQRVGLHPLDQFRAYLALRNLGLEDAEIAARHFVKVEIVRQRLRLASVSPKLLDLYAEDGITLAQLMVFTIIDDHDRQEQVWDALKGGYNREPSAIRRALTETTVKATDPRAVFVGIEAYEEAGGLVLRDLFEQDRGGWLQDVVLLERLVTEKLTAAAEAVAAEGWKWVEIAIDLPYGHEFDLRELDREPPKFTEEEEAAYAALELERDEMLAAHQQGTEFSDETRERYERVLTAIDALHDRPDTFDPADVAIGGAFVTIDGNGRLLVDRGYVREQDEPVEDASDLPVADATERQDPDTAAGVQRTVITIGGAVPADPIEVEEDATVRPLSDTLVTELTASRTVALQDAVARNPHAAMTLLLFNLYRRAYLGERYDGCLQARVDDVHFVVQPQGLKETPAALALAEREATWKARLPRDPDKLWVAIDALDEVERGFLLAHLLSVGINAVFEPVKYDNGRMSPEGIRRRIESADRVARAVGLDMVEAGWQPTYDNYLSRVTKPRILEAVREAKGDHTAQLIDHLKKGDMAREAERLLIGSGWLPEPLRVELVEAPVARDGEGTSLPAFLEGEEEPAEALDHFRAAAE